MEKKCIAKQTLFILDLSTNIVRIKPKILIKCLKQESAAEFIVRNSVNV